MPDFPEIAALVDGEVIIHSNLTLKCEFPLVSNDSDSGIHYEVRWYEGADLQELHRAQVMETELDWETAMGYGLLTPDAHGTLGFTGQHGVRARMILCIIYIDRLDRLDR